VFPTVPDQHKNGKPLVPNGLGVLYVLFAIVYLFLLYFFDIGSSTSVGISAPLTLAVCILFGGFMGLLDDWMDLKWRYKAFMPLIAALPLIYFAMGMNVRTSIVLPFIGFVDFGVWYFYLIIPLIVMIVTNTVNMLGGFNGLESICPAIVLLGLMSISALTSPSYYLLMVGPIIFWLILGTLNLKGKIFVGNSGSFAIGMTIASFAVIADVKLSLLISIIPYIFNSSLILLTVFFTGKKALIAFKDNKLKSSHKRSLVTTITYNRPLTEHKIVTIVSIIVATFTLIAFIYALISITLLG
jgi:UDP-N-acetylglucosamine--dolichyl-phosphate N-acetylglucosaminephosphotransferase